ncbi:MAG: hypothetical protein HPY61_13980 [Methanotrichaceae archaeon]|nr:hypothetical protein [Methanotrichaceae archaeon]
MSDDSYDALWPVAQTDLAAAGSNETDAFKSRLPRVAASLDGSYGSLAMNEAGDREFMSYEFLTPESINGSSQWVPVARYSSSQGEEGRITFLSP